ncbi:GrpB family protein [Solibacillus silvestris]|uniref:GrpB family protein n=1 Tax=Solibacillus silvestris TaxID=76853 RepID=UPI003F80B2B1
MKLGLKNNEVVIVPYDKRWKDEFIRIRAEIMACANLDASQIEHIGSTAIEGIYAKPVIDILIGVADVRSLEKPFFKELQNAGFYRLKVERPNEIVCAKFVDETFETKTHFIHIVDLHKEKWREMLFFRDYLNAYPAIKQQYENMKKSFLKTGLEGILSYTNYKEAFVQTIFSKMMEEKRD